MGSRRRKPGAHLPGYEKELTVQEPGGSYWTHTLTRARSAGTDRRTVYVSNKPAKIRSLARLAPAPRQREKQETARKGSDRTRFRYRAAS